MFSYRPHFRAYRTWLLLLILPCMFGHVDAIRAQGGVGSSRGLPSSSSGIQTIQGQLFFPASSQAINKRMRIRLDSPTNSISQTALTDDDGKFRFNQLEAGSYTLTVDGGKEYENATENVTIDREASSGGRIISLPIYLKLKPDPSVPKEAIDLYHKAQESARGSNHKKAVEQLNGAIALYPNFMLALLDLGVEYLALGDMAKAAETMEAVLKLAPNDPLAHLNLGIALYNLKKLDDAEPHLREAIKLNNAMAKAHYYLGLTLIAAKQYGEAQAEFELTISNGGDNIAPAHKFLGGLYMSAHKNQQAADELEKYLKLDPKAADAERIRGTIKDLRSKP